MGNREVTMRAETGPMRFGDDWTGVFIRGDNAFGFAAALRRALDGNGFSGSDGPVLERLLELLDASTEPNRKLELQRLRAFAVCLEERFGWATTR